MPRLSLPQWPWPKWLVVAGILGLTIGLAIPFHRDVRNEFDAVYRHAASLIRAGEPLYEKQPLYTYPPFMAWLIIPFTYLDRVPARIGWFLANMGSLFAMVWLAWRMVFPRQSTGTPTPSVTAGAPAASISDSDNKASNSAATTAQLSNAGPWFDRTLWLIGAFGLFLGLRPGTNSVLHHQTDLMMGACLFLGLWAIFRDWPYVGAICLGLAAAMKCTPALFAFYFLLRGPRLAAATLLLVAVGANLLPQLTSPPPGGQVLLVSWFNSVVAHLLKPGIYPGQWNVDVLTNQSFAGAVLCWMTSNWSWTSDGFKFWSTEPLLPPLVARLWVYAMGLSLLGTTLYLMRKRLKTGATDRLSRLAELSSFLLIMLLMSPMSHRTHFTTMLLPAFVVGLHFRETRSRPIAILIGILLLLQVVSLRIISINLAYFASWHGTQMLSTLALLFACWFVIEERITPSVKVESKPAPAPLPTPAMPAITKAA